MAILKTELDKIPAFKKFEVVYIDGKTKRRCEKEKEGTVFMFNPRSSRYGRRISEEDFLKSGWTIKTVDEAAVWNRKIKRAVKILSSSGLWENLLTVYTNLYNMGYDDWKAIKDIRNNITWDQEKNAVTPKERKAFYGEYAEIYPFLFDENGYLDTDYVYELSNPKFKSMYFGCSNKYYKDEIARALSDKRKYSTGRVVVSYDNSFSYDPERNMAWYSEEYRGCGNGYYYLALDGNTAVFYEKD